ncbi:MAG: hypothetical protein IKO05_11715, partial [Selenomonadaceae bacterium]|nr:hypothetical protein [Selenomonadaceae bacterium]
FYIKKNKYNKKMEFNMIPLHQKPQINKIFPDIIFDNINNNADTNFLADDIIANDSLEPFDKFFNGKRSRNSSARRNFPS